MTDKAAQLKAKLLKIKLAETDYEIRSKVNRSKSPLKKQVPFGEENRSPDKIRDDALDKSEASTSGKKIRPKKPTDEDFGGIITAKAKVNKLKKKSSIPDEIMQEASDAAGLNKNQAPSYIAQEHGHKIAFKGHKIGGFKSASLSGQSGKYAKYWLLNAKETNGNGWGIAAHTAKENMKKFIGRPLVVTASSWHGASEYGDEYEHPYLPTNDISAILNHQEKFRVGSIVDVFEDSHGDWFASVEMLPKFASSRLPPFCSPAIYQLDASEAEGQISKWEALHLAALTENPAYGARIALLKGTCVGTDNECKVQFKAAKQDGIECPIKKKERVSKLKARLAGRFDSTSIKKKKYFNDEKLDGGYNLTMPGGIEDTPKNFKHTKSKRKSPFENFQIEKQINNKLGNNNIVTNTQGTDIDKIASGEEVLNSFKNKRMKKLAKLKLKLAGLGDENMTYQDSKKVKIIKKKHPEVRKAKSGVEDILRGKGRSVDGSHSQSTFLSSVGDFIGGGVDNEPHRSQVGLLDDSELVNFQKDTGLIRVQNFPVNRSGDKKMSLGINSKVNSTQLKSIKDLETEGKTIGFSVGDLGKEVTGEGYRDLTKTLREQKFIG